MENRVRKRDILRAGIAMAVAFLMVAAVGVAETATAHAEFVSSSPAPNDILSRPPTEVRMALSEAVQPESVSIFVSNAAGVRFDEGPTSLNGSDLSAFSVQLAPFGPGIYTITWRAISADDGHLSVGSFNFAVTNPDGSLSGTLPGAGPTASAASVSPFEVAFRFLAFLGLATALGAVAFVVLVWTPILSPTGRAVPPERSKAHEDGVLALAGWGRLGAILFTAGIVGWWVTAAATEGFASVLRSPFQLSLAVRFALGVLLALGLSLSVYRSRSNVSLRPKSPIFAAAIVAGAAAVASGSAGTHGAAVTAWRPVGTVADGIHVLGASLWVGGLLALVRSWPWLRSEGVSPYAGRIFRRFSRFAFLSVGLILFGGVLLSLILVGSWDALVTTGYGAVVLAKVSLLVPMVALGAYNRYRLHAPSSASGSESLESSGLGRPPSASRGRGDRTAATLHVLERNVRVEAFLGGVVLLLAGLLATLSPPSVPSQAAPPSGIFVREATNGSLLVEFSVFPYPTGPGRYVFDIQAWYAVNRTEYIRPQNGTVNLTFVGAGKPPAAVSFIWTGVNHFFVDTEAMNRPGTWRIDLPLTAPDGSVAGFTFYLQLHG